MGQVLNGISGAVGGLVDTNTPQIDAGGNQMPAVDGTTSPGLGGKAPDQVAPGMINAAQQMWGVPVTAPGATSPGMGGKGPDYTNQWNQSTNNLPQPPSAKPLGSDQGGTPGRPVPAAPFSPRGVGYANPGAPGAPQPAQTNNLVNAPLPGGLSANVPSNLIGPTPVRKPVDTNSVLPGGFLMSKEGKIINPSQNLSPQPLGKPPVVGQITKPNKGIGTSYGPLQKGAGRGGMIR